MSLLERESTTVLDTNIGGVGKAKATQIGCKVGDVHSQTLRTDPPNTTFNIVALFYEAKQAE